LFDQEKNSNKGFDILRVFIFKKCSEFSMKKKRKTTENKKEPGKKNRTNARKGHEMR
jgi:hypothetical protein